MSKLELRVDGVTIKPSDECLSKHETMVMVAKVTLWINRSESVLHTYNYESP